jgi:starch synthase
MRVLFVASEAYPLIKTGGLGDVVYSLPHALQQQGVEVKLLLPGYRDLLQQMQDVRILGWLHWYAPGQQRDIRILTAHHPAFSFELLIADCQPLFDRPGNPYLHPDGADWPDNAERFAVFSQVAAWLGMDVLQSGWRPDLVHSHDWQTGLVSAFLSAETAAPRSLFTIHNLAYGGHFAKDTFAQLGLPWQWWSAQGMEFYGGFSMLKAGLVYADAISTVSPTYAKEICTPAFGQGMEGVLQAQRHKLVGILNGIDTDVWNPSKDPYLDHHYSVARRQPGKQHNKQAVLDYFGAKMSATILDAPILGFVGRLVEQKGIDLIAELIPRLMTSTAARVVLVGAGQAVFEERLLTLAKRYPERVFVYIGYAEALAHLVEAGSDLFLMPSRFEPCGLNQMYSLRYGTLPIVHGTGGLSDTVIDTTEATLADGTANGFVIPAPTVAALEDAIRRALALYARPKAWQKLMRQAMQADHGWETSALEYFMLYQTIIADDAVVVA